MKQRQPMQFSSSDTACYLLLVLPAPSFTYVEISALDWRSPSGSCQCGAWTQGGRIVKLLECCPRRPNAVGEAALRRLSKQFTPTAQFVWPLAGGNFPPSRLLAGEDPDDVADEQISQLGAHSASPFAVLHLNKEVRTRHARPRGRSS